MEACVSNLPQHCHDLPHVVPATVCTSRVDVPCPVPLSPQSNGPRIGLSTNGATENPNTLKSMLAKDTAEAAAMCPHFCIPEFMCIIWADPSRT